MISLCENENEHRYTITYPYALADGGYAIE